ncbi:hypothetical protein IMZ48_44490 [Candidatus Bathyarchaeota archaeon]|nr:hypothetical protein [Candidatus Bathyarchaeota archaeon]
MDPAAPSTVQPSTEHDPSKAIGGRSPSTLPPGVAKGLALDGQSPSISTPRQLERPISSPSAAAKRASEPPSDDHANLKVAKHLSNEQSRQVGCKRMVN